MSNELKFGNKVVFLNGNPITLPIATSDPGSPSQGDMYFNSTSNVVRVYNGTTWNPLLQSLVGDALSSQNILVGNGSNLSASVDTTSTGDILANSSTALTIKSGVITNTMVNASAAIAYSKLNLSNSIVNADINASAAIAYSKLNLTASVKAGDINSEAATNGQVLTANGSGGATWTTNGNGTVTSVALSDGSSTPIYTVSGSPVTSSGTLTLTLSTQTANKVFAGPSSGGAAQPTFRSLVAADIPSLPYATTALDNLASVAINTALLPGTTATLDIGSTSKVFVAVHAASLTAQTTDATVTTNSSNADVVLTANGTGNQITKATIRKASQSAASTSYKEEQYFDALTLAANTSSFTTIASLTMDSTSFRGAILEYTIREATSDKQRTGTMKLSTDGTNIGFSDEFVETSPLGTSPFLQFQAVMNSTNVEIQFNNTDATNACTMRVEVKRFRA